MFLRLMQNVFEQSKKKTKTNKRVMIAAQIKLQRTLS